MQGAVPALLLSAFVMGGWGISFFTNSVTSRLLGPNSTTFQALFLNVLGRSLALSVIIPILELSQSQSQSSAAKPAQADQDATGQPLPLPMAAAGSSTCGRFCAGLRRRGPPRTLAISWDLAVPFAGQILTNFAFVPYIELAGESEVSVLTVMTGLHSVLPAAWGLIVWGEERTWAKLAGIALSAAAVLLLGLADATSFLGSATTPAEIVAKVALFILATGMWGAADVLNACVRRLSASETAMLTLAANLASAIVFAWVGLVQNLQMLANITSADVAKLQSTVPFGWRHVVMLLANVSNIGPPGGAVASPSERAPAPLSPPTPSRLLRQRACLAASRTSASGRSARHRPSRPSWRCTCTFPSSSPLHCSMNG